MRQIDPDGHLGLSDGLAAPCSSNASGSAYASSAEIQASAQKYGAQATQDLGTQKVGGETVNGLTNVLTNESRDLTGGKPGNLEAGKIAEANAIINNNLLKHPGEEASDVLSKGTAASAERSDDEIIMRQAYLDRLAGKPDPVAGRTYFGNSAEDLTSRPIGSGRQTVFAQFGPFDHGKGTKQYIYIYNDPVLNKR